MDELLALEPVIVNGETVYVNRFGDLWRWKRHRKWTSPKFARCVNNPKNDGYIRPTINGKSVYLHRIISATFLGLDMNDLKVEVDHINGVKHDNRLENLRLVTHQQNNFNNHMAKGYSWNKRDHNWNAHIGIDGKQYNLGYFDSEERAREAYLEAKTRLHIITKVNG
jgi:uncharacterized secreted protein with C-terminal beta-propeller domain